MPKASWAYGASTDDQLFDALCAIIRSRIPGFRIQYKDESILSKIIGFLIFFNRDYMTKYTTTLGDLVKFPSRKFVEENKWKAFKILAHEYVHILDNDKAPVMFKILYAAPQWLGLLSLVALLAIWFSNWWLMALVCLIFFVPWPSPRAHLEMRGYSMNIAINMWRHGDIIEKTREWLVEKFIGWPYYKMAWRESTVREWIAETEELVHNLDRMKPDATIFETSVAFQDVYQLLTDIEFDEAPTG